MAMPAIAAAETLKIGGTGAGLATMQMLGEAFSRSAPGVTVAVLPNLGTRGGLKALGAGVIDIAVTSRPLEPEETAQGLTAVVYGQTALVFATDKPQGTRSIGELVEMYAGRRATWADGSPIRLILRPRNDGDTFLLQAISPEMKQAVESAMERTGLLVASTDQDAAQAIEKSPGALGVSSLAIIQSEGRQVSMLRINGVEPGIKSIASGSYPFVKAMYAVRKSQAREVTLRFMAFIASPQGRQILSHTGHWVPSGN